jgi:hypothetical protein
MKLLPLLLSTILLNGCVASSYVSSIGAKSIHGDTKINLVETDLYYSERVSNPFGVIEGKSLLKISSKSDDTDTVKFNYDNIIWAEKGSTSGKIDLLVKGKLLTFSVFKTHKYIELTYDYRNWYSYPAQSLLIFSIPADVVITTVAVPIIGIGMLVYALLIEPPLH